MADSKDSGNANTLLNPMNQILGAPGTWLTGGYITNEEYLQKLMWRQGIDVYDHMRRSDASIQALLKVCKHPLLSATWTVEAASDQPFDQYVQRFVENELKNRNVLWHRFLQDALGKLDFGFSVFEKTYEMTEFEGQTRVGIQDLGWRKQWSILRWETSQGQPGITQQLMGELVDIPQDKLVVFVNDREGDNYQGISLLRYVYKDWEFKKAVEQYMIVAAQRSLGFPVVEYNPTASAKDQQAMERTLENFRNHERQYMFFPLGRFKVDWMKIETNIEKDLIPMLEYYQHEIDKSVLAQFMDLAGSRSGGSSGSHALSADQSQLFEKALGAVANEIVGQLNTNLIQQLCDLNWTSMPNGYPKLTFSNIGDKNLSSIGTYMNALAAVDLLTPDRDLENWIRQALPGAPDLPDDIYDNYDDRVTAQTAAVPLTPLGPGQDPNAPAPTGQVLQNPATQLPGHNKPGTKLPGDQANKTTETNDKSDNANKPTPEANSYKIGPSPAKASQGFTTSTSITAAMQNAKQARQDLINSVMRG